MLLTAPRTSYDAVARRRTRRALSRLRPLLLPLALVVTGLVVASALGPPPPVEPLTLGPAVPPGRVLVVVSPADPAVLGVAVPGSVVDVYAAPVDAWALTGDGTEGAGARLLVREALVVGRAPPGGRDAASAPLAPAPAGDRASSVTLAVTDEQARALAGAGTAGSGGALSLAVRGPAAGRVSSSDATEG